MDAPGDTDRDVFDDIFSLETGSDENRGEVRAVVSVWERRNSLESGTFDPNAICVTGGDGLLTRQGEGK